MSACWKPIYYIFFSIFSQDETGEHGVKKVLLAAYAAFFLTFAMTFIQCRMSAPAESAYAQTEIESAAASAGVQIPSPEPTKTAKPEEVPVTEIAEAPSPAPATVTVKNGDEVQEMDMQSYLVGVVAAEMPASFEPEALKAQSVAARSYALYCASTGRHGDTAQVCTDYSCCQAWSSEDMLHRTWGDGYDEKLEKIRDAVEATAGEYLCYDGAPVFAAFHSSSAGATEDCGAVWSARPYLVSVDSPETAEEVPNYISSVELSALDFRDTVLYARPDADFTGDESEWIGEITHDGSGRVASVILGGEKLSGTELRSLFSLRSTAFTLEYTGSSFLFTVTGFGHGVGMSQYGANAMAKSGADYREILAHYYPGTQLVK